MAAGVTCIPPQHCLHCRVWPEATNDFQKIIHFRDIGLAIYRYTTRISGNAKESPDRRQITETFILENTKDMKISAADLLSELEKQLITCPRCLNNVKRVLTLLRNVTNINKKEIRGVCDHCIKKQRGCKCDNIIKKFKSSQPPEYPFNNIAFKRNVEEMAESSAVQLRTLVDSPISFDDNVKNERLLKEKAMKEKQYSESIDTSERIKQPFFKEKKKHEYSVEDDFDRDRRIDEKSPSSQQHRDRYADKKDYDRKRTDERSPRTQKDKEDKRKAKTQYADEEKFEKKHRTDETALRTQTKDKEDKKKPRTQHADEENFEKKRLTTAKDLRTQNKDEEDKRKPRTQHATEENFEKRRRTDEKDPETQNKDGDDKKKHRKDEKSPKAQHVDEEDFEKRGTKKGKDGKVEKSEKVGKSGQTEKNVKDTKIGREYKIREEEKGKIKGEYEKKSSGKGDKKKHAVVVIDKPELDKKSRRDSTMIQTVISPNSKELQQQNIKMINSLDDLVLRLIQIRKGPENVKSVSAPDGQLVKKVTSRRKCHKKSQVYVTDDIESDEDILESKGNVEEIPDIIIGTKIRKHTSPLTGNEEGTASYPIYKVDCTERKVKDKAEKEVPINIPTDNSMKGVIRYALSDRSFIDKGWTVLPTKRVVRKMNVYRMRPAKPEFDWFKHNKNKQLMNYDSGEVLAEFDEKGHGRWYYRNGRVALDYYDTEETNARQRYVIYSSGEPDDRGRPHPYTVLAVFDYLGNGIVYDYSGKVRLKYNQTEGVLLDRNVGPESHWKWHTLNDSPVIQEILVDTQMPYKDENILNLGDNFEAETQPERDEEMLAIEFENFVKEKSIKLNQTFKPFQIRMKALKINKQFSLKVLDQATIYLIFRDGLTNLKLNLGMILDQTEIIDTDVADLGPVAHTLEKYPALTDSLARIQKTVQHAQNFEKMRLEHDRRLNLPEKSLSVDKLTAAVSRPMRPPFRTVPSCSSTYTSI